jgi:hypothetical protein
MNRLIPEGFLHSRFTGEQLNNSLLHFLTGINFLKPESLLFARISGLDEEVDAIKTETPVSSTSSAIGLNNQSPTIISTHPTNVDPQDDEPQKNNDTATNNNTHQNENNGQPFNSPVKEKQDAIFIYHSHAVNCDRFN